METFEVEVVETVRRRISVKIQALSRMHACSLAEDMDTGAESGDTTEELVKREVDRRSAIPVDTRARMDVELVPGSVSQLRRSAENISVGDLFVDIGKPEVTWKGEQVRLTHTLLRCLVQLAGNAGKHQTCDDLLGAIHDHPENLEETAASSMIKRLRNTFRDVDAGFDEIETRRGLGYRWREVEDREIPAHDAAGRPILHVDRVRNEFHFCGQPMPLSAGKRSLLLAMTRYPGTYMDNRDMMRHGCPLSDPDKASHHAPRTVIKLIRNAARTIEPGVDLFESAYGIGSRINPAICVINAGDDR